MSALSETNIHIEAKKNWYGNEDEHWNGIFNKRKYANDKQTLHTETYKNRYCCIKP